jgi:hypothetical protein
VVTLLLCCSDPPAPAAALPDLAAGLDRAFCEYGPGEEGATAYFVGEFTLSGARVAGRERWLLYANSRWRSAGGRDCTATWDVAGRTSAPSTCADCDLGLALEATLAGTDCPEALLDRQRTFSVGYDVTRAQDGTARFSFSSSGKALGQGYHAGDALGYVTDPTCTWF